MDIGLMHGWVTMIDSQSIRYAIRVERDRDKLLRSRNACVLLRPSGLDSHSYIEHTFPVDVTFAPDPLVPRARYTYPSTPVLT
jgi:hypothetical protein